MTKRKVLTCPVPGCGKRGQHGDLMRHARAKHATFASGVYQTALLRGDSLVLHAWRMPVQAQRMRTRLLRAAIVTLAFVAAFFILWFYILPGV